MHTRGIIMTIIIVIVIAAIAAGRLLARSRNN
jgi:hypothetical protein